MAVAMGDDENATRRRSGRRPAEHGLGRDALVELDVGGSVAGGACLARHGGRVFFVRHALPGERVRAEITDDRGAYCRADAVEILVASPDRVVPPCPYAGPGRCGGCDWQHASDIAQLELKAEALREQFARIGGIAVDDVFAGVEPLPGGLLGWRTRIGYAVDGTGRAGLHRHRSTALEHVDRCLLGVPGVGNTPALTARWPGWGGVEVVRGDDEAVTVLGRAVPPRRTARGRRPPDVLTVLSGPDRVRHAVRGRSFEVAAGGFWQVHPAAADALAGALLAGVRPQPGERVLELYAGAGALTASLAETVGPNGALLAVEAAAQAVDDATRNLADLSWVELRRARVTAALLADLGEQPDVVVLDPPRAGAGRDLIAAIIALAPRVVGYVSCDPGTLARDVAAARDAGWQLTALRAFDAFPMTAHVECVATLQPRPAP